jgi:hypothetical protein
MRLPKTGSGIAYKQMFIDAKLQTGKRGHKMDLTGRSPLKR